MHASLLSLTNCITGQNLARYLPAARRSSAALAPCATSTRQAAWSPLTASAHGSQGFFTVRALPSACCCVSTCFGFKHQVVVT